MANGATAAMRAKFLQEVGALELSVQSDSNLDPALLDAADRALFPEPVRLT